MKTILFNTLTNKPISKIYENGYGLPIPEDYVIEIEVVETPKPKNCHKKRAISHFEFQNNKWVRVWEVVEREQSFLIKVKQEFLAHPEAFLMFLKINSRGLQIAETADGFVFECNEIKDEEAFLIEKYPELITVEEAWR